MAKKKSGAGSRSLQLNLPVTVRVKPVRIRPSPSLAYLDTARLDKAARAEFELGEIQSGECRNSVYAVVKKGMVTGLRLHGCHDEKKGRMDPGLQKALQEIRKRLGSGERPQPPLPVSEFLRQKPERSRCFMFCLFGFCIICCGFLSDIGTWGCVIIGRDRSPD